MSDLPCVTCVSGVRGMPCIIDVACQPRDEASNYKRAAPVQTNVNAVEDDEYKKALEAFGGGDIYAPDDAKLVAPKCPQEEFNASGAKYLRTIIGDVHGKIDTYGVMETFSVKCPARQHALKKLLCAGLRGKGGTLQDLIEARDAVSRAIDLERAREYVLLQAEKQRTADLEEQLHL